MSPLDRPRLRPYLSIERGDRFGRYYFVCDPLRLSNNMLRINTLDRELLRLFDGSRSLPDVQAEVIRQTGWEVPLEYFSRLAAVLDEATFLDGEPFREQIRSPIRPPSCIGVYPEDPDEVRRQLRQLFLHPQAAGLPGDPRPDKRLRAVLAPHIDYGRGGLTYTHAFKELFERSDASLFVIIGTSHHSMHRFTLTRKHFRTPLGVVQTNGKYIDLLEAHYGNGLFDDELLAHLPEHSIELEVVFLQYLYEQKRAIQIVPLVVGSFQDCVHSGESPQLRGDIQRMVGALQAVEREMDVPICYVISGDLAHIGPKFGDPEAVHANQLEYSQSQDRLLLNHAERADQEGFFEVIRYEFDERRICGLPPTWLVLEASRPTSGRVLHYDQYVHPDGDESVSFASVVFDRSEECD